MTLDELNRADAPVFVAALAAIYEHSPWVAEAAEPRRPFGSLAELHAAMAGAVAAAPDARRRALVAAHPELAGRLAQAGELAPASASEQSRLGLDRLTAEELAEIDALNAAYRARFGFPFVAAVRRHADRASLMAAFAARLTNEPEAELRAALAEIDMIALFRLRSLLGGDA